MGEASGATEAEALRGLQERLDRATEAAERLLADAVRAGAPPAAGWRRRAAESEAASRWGGWLTDEDAELLVGILAGVRDRLPAELQQRLAAALREVLLALRALIDWCLERAERRRAAPAEVQDIPIL